jgi:hypothetical protein
MKMNFFKPFVAFVLVLSLLTFPSCTKEPELPPDQEQREQEEKVTLTTANAKDYIGTNLCFSEIYVTDMPSKDTERLSCVCNIEVFPVGDYRFEQASVTISPKSRPTIVLYMPETEWFVSPAEITVKLDKDGYGRASVYFSCVNHPKEAPDSVPQEAMDVYTSFRENYKHPLESAWWYIETTKASGTVTKEK